MRSLAIVAVLASTTSADPPCLDYTSARINGKDGKLLVCTGEAVKCTAFADAKAAPTPADWPGNPTSPNGHYGKIDNKLAVCFDTTCKKVGDKLTRAAFHVQAEITTDLAVVVLEGTPWSVAGDAPLKLKRPDKAQTDIAIAHAAGASLIVEWRNCADTFNCDGVAQVTDTAGKNIGPTFPAGEIILLDAHRAAVLGYGRTLTSIDTDSHAQLGHVDVIGKGALQELAVGRIDDATVGAAWSLASQATWKLAWVKVPAGKPPALGATRTVPVCAP